MLLIRDAVVFLELRRHDPSDEDTLEGLSAPGEADEASGTPCRPDTSLSVLGQHRPSGRCRHAGLPLPGSRLLPAAGKCTVIDRTFERFAFSMIVDAVRHRPVVAAWSSRRRIDLLLPLSIAFIARS